MGMKSKNKGKRGELEAARIFSAWWTGNNSLLKAKAESLPIRRTPLSGGWSKARGIGGDLVPVWESAKDFSILSVEVKNQEAWSFDGMLKNEGWPINDWWRQCCESATEANAVPLLIFTKNHHPFYFCMKIEHLKRLFDQTSTVVRRITYFGRCYGLLDDLLRFYPKKCFLKAFEKDYGAPKR